MGRIYVGGKVVRIEWLG